MKTITVLQYSILYNMTNGLPISKDANAHLAIAHLIAIGLIKKQDDDLVLVKGESYNYAGNTYTI